MGLYTDYSLVVRGIKNEKKFEELQEELENKELILYAFQNGAYDVKNHEAYFPSYEDTTWRDHSKTMVMISEKFPKMTFELECVGNNYTRFWKEYYHDGVVETCDGDVVYAQPKRVQWNDLIQF